MMTPELLETTARYFARKEVASPRLTIELMLAEIWGKTRLQLYLEYNTPVPDAVLDRLRPLVKRRAEGEPLEYLMGVTTFAGQRYAVSPEVLIPRPDTELLVEKAADLIDPASDLPISDIGTGCGIIVCSLARRFPHLSFFAVDVSGAALQVAKANAVAQNLPNVTFCSGDLLTSPELPSQFQLIAANLPYIPGPILPTLSREVQREPKIALDGGVEGLDLIQRLVEQSVGRTLFLALEFGDGQAESIKTSCQEHGYIVTQVVTDFIERERILFAKYNG